MRTRSPDVWQSSIGTIVSAPAGIGAPVAIEIASPPPTVPSGRCPISARPTTRSSTGDEGVASATSDDRTANPSIALEANSGMSRSATTSRASTHPNASVSGSSRVGAERSSPGRGRVPRRRGRVPRRCRGRARGRSPCRRVYRRVRRRRKATSEQALALDEVREPAADVLPMSSRSIASSIVAFTASSLLPTSNRPPSNTYAYTAWSCASTLSASVSWISPPTPGLERLGARRRSPASARIARSRRASTARPRASASR